MVILPRCPLTGLPVAPSTDQAVLDQNLWAAGEAKKTGWQLASKAELDAQAEPGRQRAGRPWALGKNLSIGPGAGSWVSPSYLKNFCTPGGLVGNTG